MPGISYASGITSQPLLGQTIGDFLDDIAAAHSDREALVSCHQQLRYTYGQLRAEVDRIARALMALGVAKGDRVGIWSLNCAQWCITQLASAKIGAILVNINPSYRPRELEHALSHAGVATLIVQGAYKQSRFVDMLCELAPELARGAPQDFYSARLPALKHVICLDEALATPAMWGWPALRERHVEVEPGALAARQAELQFDDAINIQYTSGTTGVPKGVTLTHHNILNNGFFVADAMPIGPGDRVVIPVPLYHCFGMVMGNLGCISHAATIVYPNAAFDAEATLAAVERERACALYGVPTMFIAELESPAFDDFDLSRLRTGIMAGANCPVAVMQNVIEQMHMDGVTVCYGMTETSPVSTQTLPDAPLNKRVATVGCVHPHQEIKLVDPASGAVVSLDTPGELCTRGYSVMQGYWADEAATRQAIDGNAWMHSGDLATMDAQGYVAITGRIKDMIVRGGENIYPREIEEFLYTHPAVSDVQVFGVRDAQYGEQVAAWIRVAEAQQLTEDALKAFCNGKIARYKIPRYVKFVDGFPMTVTGKVQKFRMREAAERELGLGGS